MKLQNDIHFDLYLGQKGSGDTRCRLCSDLVFRFLLQFLYKYFFQNDGWENGDPLPHAVFDQPTLSSESTSPVATSAALPMMS